MCSLPRPPDNSGEVHVTPILTARKLELGGACQGQSWGLHTLSLSAALCALWGWNNTSGCGGFINSEPVYHCTAPNQKHGSRAGMPAFASFESVNFQAGGEVTSDSRVTWQVQVWIWASGRAVGASEPQWCQVSGEVSHLEMPLLGLLSHPLRMEPASWILVWLAAVLGFLPSFRPSPSPGSGLFSPIPSYPEVLSRIRPYAADAWERTSWPSEGKLFSNPCGKWAVSLPCAARHRVFLAGYWAGPDTAEPHSWGAVQIRKPGLGGIVGGGWVE